MSGNRANAAARNRRAGGGPEMQPPPRPPPRPPLRPGQQIPPNQMQQNQMQQNQGINVPKQMTIQSAVELITIRLGRVETFMQKFESENSSDDNARIVDDGVFNSIISRLDALERGHKLLTTTKSIPANDNLNDQLSEDINLLKAEVSQVKDLLLKLQSFTMETNQKLLEVVMHEEEEQEQLIFVENENENENEEEDSKDIVESLNVNLKELIQKELASNE